MLSIIPRVIGVSKASSWTPSYFRHFTFSSHLCLSYAELDDEKRRAYLEKNGARKKSRLLTDPDFREKENQRTKDFQKISKHKEEFVLRYALYRWIKRCPWVCTELPWKSYRPIYYNHRVEHLCTGCAWTRRNGLRLWWARDVGASNSYDESDSHEYLCGACYSQRGWNEAMPAGYEDIRHLKDLVKRKKQLDDTTFKKISCARYQKRQCACDSI